MQDRETGSPVGSPVGSPLKSTLSSTLESPVGSPSRTTLSSTSGMNRRISRGIINQTMASEVVGEFTFTTETVGEFRVTVQEKNTDSDKFGSLITIHDIGLNRESFTNFFNDESNVQFFDKFIVYHIEIPGQHKHAEPFAPEYQFPSLGKMGDRLIAVLERFHLQDVIGLGVGAGAVTLIHLAMSAPEKFLGITVIDPIGKSSGFKEWGEQKLAAFALEKKGFTTSAQKFLIWHLFGTKGKKIVNFELVDQCIKDIATYQNAYNLSQYIKAYMNREDFLNDVTDKLKCHVLIITSVYSPSNKDDAYNFAAKLDPTKVSVLESSETINAFIEDPGKCGEGMLLLMQGLGLVPTLRTRTASRGAPGRRESMSEDV